MTLDPFEQNSIHLMDAGYIFAIARVQDNCVDGVPACVIPMWIKEDDIDSEDTVRAILGSEPRIGEHPEVVLNRAKIEHLVYSDIKEAVPDEQTDK